MRNLIRFRLRRYFFRWETFAAAMINIIAGCLSGAVLLSLYSESSGPKYEIYLFPAAFMVSMMCTMAAVLITEDNNISNGAVRNQLIAGYTKSKVYISGYLTSLIYGTVQGILFMLPVNFFEKQYIRSELGPAYLFNFLISCILMYASVSCIAVAVSLLTGKRAISVLICFSSAIALIFGGIYCDKRLEEPEYHYSEKWHWSEDGADIERVELIKDKNMIYVGGASRTAIENFIRIDPMEPVWEFSKWYLSDRSIVTYNIHRYEGAPQYAAETDDKIANYDRHTDRLLVFPYYQAAFIVLTGLAGLLVCRRRNFK